MIVKPAISFVRTDTDAQLVTHTQTIILSMTDNANFPSPSPTLAVLATAKDEFATALANAANGGTELTVIKNEKRAALAGLLRQLALYVSMACKGKMAVLLSSGFPTQKPVRTPAGVLPSPAAPVLSLGARSGELAASTTPIANGSIYNWRAALAAEPGVSVQEVQTTAASVTFERLTPGQIYRVDVNVVGSAGPSDFSDSAQLMVV